MRWLTLAVLCLCALSATAQDVNKNPNKKEPPILGPHWSNGAARSHNAGSNRELVMIRFLPRLFGSVSVAFALSR